MEELELYKLSYYMPHVIECIADDGFRGVLMQLALKEIDFDFQVKLADGNNFQWRYLEGVKPILRPLSDLKVEINQNGKIFTPNNWINENYIGAKYDNGLKTLFGFKTYQHLPFALFQKLLEWHFDIFNLIDKGLAVDINTLSVE
ncbi:hypothetical protein DSECCO2_269010 [anaerobic digester metagenome]